MNTLRSRAEAMTARAVSAEGLLEESRQTMMARADELRSFERRVVETMAAHDNAVDRIAMLQAVLAERDQRIAELEQSHDALREQVRIKAGREATPSAAIIADRTNTMSSSIDVS